MALKPRPSGRMGTSPAAQNRTSPRGNGQGDQGSPGGLSGSGARNPINPNNADGMNEYIRPIERADISTVLPGGNVVDRNRIPKTLDRVSSKASQALPGGAPSTTGY